MGQADTRGRNSRGLAGRGDLDARSANFYFEYQRIAFGLILALFLASDVDGVPGGSPQRSRSARGEMHMRVKKPVIVRSSYEQESLRSRFSSGLTSALRRVSPARWGFSGATLVNPELVGSR